MDKRLQLSIIRIYSSPVSDPFERGIITSFTHGICDIYDWNLWLKLGTTTKVIFRKNVDLEIKHGFTLRHLAPPLRGVCKIQQGFTPNSFLPRTRKIGKGQNYQLQLQVITQLWIAIYRVLYHRSCEFNESYTTAVTENCTNTFNNRDSEINRDL